MVLNAVGNSSVMDISMVISMDISVDISMAIIMVMAMGIQKTRK